MVAMIFCCWGCPASAALDWDVVVGWSVLASVARESAALKPMVNVQPQHIGMKKVARHDVIDRKVEGR
jgi:hypothetical protein